MPSRAGTHISAKMADSQMKWRTNGGSAMFLRTLHVVGREGAEYAGRETATLPQDVRGRPYAESAPAPGPLGRGAP